MLTTSKLGIHVIPGFATINKDLRPAIEIGVDVIRVACHCTEADITARHIGFARDCGKEVYGVLMMSHMETKEVLIEECNKMVSYGAEGVILMDSAGAYLPRDVREKVGFLASNLDVPLGFHAHNNLGLSVANSLAAVESGALIIDGTILGFGAGAGNAPLEVLIAVFDRYGFDTGVDLYKILDCAETSIATILPSLPTIKPTSIVSGLSGVFSGFAVHVDRIAKQYGIDPRDIYFELGRRKVVAGQEDLIIEVAKNLRERATP
jgi:4-hydroxy 2-oxovalerate aldolase